MLLVEEVLQILLPVFTKHMVVLVVLAWKEVAVHACGGRQSGGQSDLEMVEEVQEIVVVLVRPVMHPQLTSANGGNAGANTGSGGGGAAGWAASTETESWW